jgi:hypothetical protein
VQVSERSRNASDPVENREIALDTKNGARAFSEPSFVTQSAIYVRMAFVVLRGRLEELRIRSAKAGDLPLSKPGEPQLGRKSQEND